MRLPDWWPEEPVEYAVLGAIAALVGVLVALFGSIAYSNSAAGRRACSPLRAEVLDRAYSPGGVGSGTSTAVTSSGQVAVGSTVVVIPESWVLILRDERGNVFRIDVKASRWARAHAGEKTRVCGHWWGYTELETAAGD